MQAQVTPSQQNLQYHGYPQSSQAQYAPEVSQSDSKTPQPEFANGYTNGVDMNPYQQYAGGYGPPVQHPQQHPQQSQPQSQISHSSRAYMPSNQLPPLVPQMGSTGAIMPPPSQYPMASLQSMPPQQQQQQHPQTLLPPSSSSRAASSGQHQEKKMSSSSVRDGLKYSLHVVQQPQRARMCGFGDKDRRPITPPPCVRLVIVDEPTNREIDVNDITSDPSFFVLQVDLWAESADREANVVRASSNSPAVSISSATTTSYPPPAEHSRQIEQPVMYINPETGQPMYASMPGYAVPITRPGMLPPQVSQFGGGIYYPQYMQPAQSSSAMYTRNLIGSLTVNAARLTDTEGKLGYWFVLQDLSVRTEGFFRLRMSFIDISNHGAPGVNRGKAPVLAWTFSDKFQVYSAKKFPGVIESTPLSKCFAGQGIKIPIRKDNKNEAQDDDDGD